jgi:hypothetical protein
MPAEQKAKAYLLDGCPFSFKFWLFMVESGLAGHLEVVRCSPQQPGFQETKALLSERLGRPATFPTVEVQPGQYRADSDALIREYATRYRIDVSACPALAFYKETLFPQLLELHKMKGEH